MNIFTYQDILSQYLEEYLADLEPADQALLEPFIKHCLRAKPATPGIKWITKAAKIVDELDRKELSTLVENAVDIVEKEIKSLVKAAYPDFQFLSDQSLNCFKGMIWAITPLDDRIFTKKIESIALLCFKRISGHGPVSIKLAHACLTALSMLPPDQAIMKLSVFKHKIKTTRTKKVISKLTNIVADRAGIPANTLTEIAIEDFGLTAERRFEFLAGNARAILQLDHIGRGQTMWRYNGKIQKSVPSKIKKDYPQSLKEYQEITAAIRSAIPIQKSRIENLYLEEREWKYDHWYKYYIKHRLVGIVAQRLIWVFVKGKKQEAGIFHHGKIITIDKVPIDWIDANTIVKMWHPIHFRAENILAWRNLLDELRIQQPFKQAYREVYLLTDAERNTLDYSNRFAAHILKQNQFSSLCRVRDWKFSPRGEWYTDHPSRYYPRWEIRAEFWVEVDWDGDQTPGGLFKYVFSDQVRFYQDDVQLELEEVPPILFTEIMRDVDLFVGVTSIGNDPNWQDGDNERLDTYWSDYAFGELSQSAETRKEALQKLVPRLKIAERCSFDGKFLIVKGDIRSYKIHLGSGNILMTPNDQYLCIVPDAKKAAADKVFLPFEGDRMLSIILSKVFMLANDTGIKDGSIVSQIENVIGE